MYLSKLAGATKLINLDFPHSEVPRWLDDAKGGPAKQTLVIAMLENVSQSAGDMKIPACPGHQSYQGG